MTNNKYIIVIILLAALNIYQWSAPKGVVLPPNNQVMLDQINESQQRLDSILSVRSETEYQRVAKLDSIHVALSDITQNIVRTKDLEKYEKQVLFNASDDDNLEYFHDYIGNYRTARGTGKDTIQQ